MLSSVIYKGETMSKQHADWTYNDLKAWIESLTPDQREASITIHDDEADEYYPIRRCWTANETDVLDIGSPVITF